MMHSYKILDDVYYWLISWKKNIEVRLLNEKSSNIQIDDYILFNNKAENNKYIKVKVINKNIFNSIDELLNNYDINRIVPNYSKDELIKLLNQIYGNSLIDTKLVAFEFEYITSDLDIEIDKYKEPYIKQITDDRIINLTGQSGSGKSTYAKEKFDDEKYEIIDTDDIFSDKRFNESSGLNNELGKYFRKKYKILPNLSTEFDLIYKEIIDYCKDINKTIVIDCAQFHCIKDINILRGKVIVIRTDIDTCYNRTIYRWLENHKQRGWNYTEEELNSYKERKKGIYTWYKETNKFIRKIDCL